MKSTHQKIYRTITDVIHYDEEFSYVYTESTKYTLYNLFLRDSIQNILGKKVAIVTDTEWNLIKIISNELAEKNKRLYVCSEEKIKYLQNQREVVTSDLYTSTHEAHRKWVVDEWGEHKNFYEMQRKIPHIRRKELGIPLKNRNSAWSDLVAYTFEEMEAIMRWWAVITASSLAVWNEKSAKPLDDDAWVRECYYQYLSLGKYLPVELFRLKEREYSKFVEWVATVMGKDEQTI